MGGPLVLQFGSCNRQNLPQHFWNQLGAMDSAVFLWTGDAAYVEDNSLEAQRRALQEAKHGAEYSRFAAGRAVYGTWDDHDYGVNDGGRTVDNKGARQEAFLDFLGLQDQDVVDREGVYYSKDFYFSDSVDVKVIFLDTRSHRDMHYVRSLGELHLPFTALISAFIRLSMATLGIGRAHDGDVLGEAQWTWLESLLRDSTADVHVLVSSVQVSTSNPVVESWGHFPKAKTRLLQLFQKYDPPGLLLISGDVHHGEVSNIPFSRVGGEKGQWYEITSSGLTHSCRDSKFTEHICPVMLRSFNAHRAGNHNFLMERNFGLLSISTIGVPGEEGLRYETVLNATVSSLESSRRLEQIIHFNAERGAPILRIHDVSFSHIFESGAFMYQLCVSLLCTFLFGSILYRGFPRRGKKKYDSI